MFNSRDLRAGREVVFPEPDSIIFREALNFYGKHVSQYVSQFYGIFLALSKPISLQ